MRLAGRLVGIIVFASAAAVQPLAQGKPAAADTVERVDYLTFAQGAVPVAIGGSGAALGVTFEKAIRAVDGDPTGFALMQKPGSAESDFEFIYELPALTTFDRFAVPNVLETPSPAATFTRVVEVHGSTEGPDRGYALLASGELATHKGRGQVTELAMRQRAPVRWIKLRLAGGIQVLRPQTFFEFSEIIGNGTQEAAAFSDRFTGAWKGRGVSISLRQDGPVVTGCYDTDGELSGTVTGNLLRAVGIGRGDKVPSAFILSVAADGTLRGLRSTNRAPFVLYTGAGAPGGPSCPRAPEPALGCGSVIHGITFDFDSADIRRDSDAVLARLYDGLRADPSSGITIEGHTSSEGSDAYNQRLSERRAQAVVADLVKRGLAATRLSAAGLGESRPIASNTDESGRSLNRRVEVRCH